MTPPEIRADQRSASQSTVGCPVIVAALAGVLLAMGGWLGLASFVSADGGSTVATIPGSRIPVAIKDRIKYVEGLNEVQKRELDEKRRKFDALLPAQKERLRNLGKELADHKQSTKLSSTLTAYHKFLVSLDDNELIKLRTATDDGKIETIKEIETARAELMVREPIPSDTQAIYQWTLEHATKHRDMLVKRLGEIRQEGQPGAKQPQRPDMMFGPGGNIPQLIKAIQSGPPERAEIAVMLIYLIAKTPNRMRAEAGDKLAPSQEEVDQLIARLSPVLAEHYKAARPEQRPWILAQWQWHSVFTLGRGTLSNDEVYAETAKLPDADQKALAALPMEIRKKWLAKRAFDERMGIPTPPPGTGPMPGFAGFGGPRFDMFMGGNRPRPKKEPGKNGPPGFGPPGPGYGPPPDGPPPGPPPDGPPPDGPPDGPPPDRPEDAEDPSKPERPNRPGERLRKKLQESAEKQAEAASR